MVKCVRITRIIFAERHLCDSVLCCKGVCVRQVLKCLTPCERGWEAMCPPEGQHHLAWWHTGRHRDRQRTKNTMPNFRNLDEDEEDRRRTRRFARFSNNRGLLPTSLQRLQLKQHLLTYDYKYIFEQYCYGDKNNILPGIGYPSFFFHRFFLRVAPLVTFFFPSPSFTLQ